MPFKKVNYNVDSNELFTNIYLTKSNLVEITNNDLLPKGNTIKKYVKITLKYFNYAVTTHASLIEVIIGRNSLSGIFLERKANPNDKLKLTKKLTKPIIPTPKIPQNNKLFST